MLAQASYRFQCSLVLGDIALKTNYEFFYADDALK